MQLTTAQVAQATGARAAEAERFRPHLQAACVRFGINTPRRVAGFLAQVGHESAGMTRLVENLDYSVQALLTTFGRHRITEADARRFGRTPYQRANQEGIACCLYGGPWGAARLGNTQPGDGWRFRGRGLKQLTGRDNYRRAGTALGIDLQARPELLEQPEAAALSAAWFWSVNGLNAVADGGDVERMTRIINGGTLGLDRRAALYNQALTALA